MNGRRGFDYRTSYGQAPAEYGRVLTCGARWNCPGEGRLCYAYAAPTMIFLIRMYGDPCEMLLVCVG